MSDRESLRPAEQRVLSLIDEGTIIDLAQSLIRAPGENPPGGEGPRATVLARACTEAGLDTRLREVEPGRPNLSAVLAGDDGPGLLLLGHTDVVPLGHGWDPDLARGAVRAGRLYGRGSADMLGGLAAVVAALSAVREANVELSGPVQLVAVVDEEETGVGVRRWLADEAAGSRWHGCIVAEPTDLQTIVAARGDMYVEVRVLGRPAHSGNPADGANAISGAARVVTEIERWQTELAAHPHPLVGPATWSVGTVSGGTGTSIVPAECRLTIDRRTLPNERPQDVVAELKRRLACLDLPPGLSLEVTATMDMPSFETPTDHPFVRVVDRAVAAAGGPRLPIGGWTAACDGGYVARETGLPVLVLGPGSVTSQAHRANESVAVADLVLAAQAYALTVVRLMSGTCPSGTGKAPA